MEKLSGQKLYEIAHKNETADAITHALASRERLRHHIDIRRLKYALKKEKFKIIDSDYMSLWKEWEKMGIGSIVRGRIGKEDRFEMNYDMRKIAESSINATDFVVDNKINPIVLVRAIKRRKKRIPTPKPIAIPEIVSKHKASIIIETSNGLTIKLPDGATKVDIQEIVSALNDMS